MMKRFYLTLFILSAVCSPVWANDNDCLSQASASCLDNLQTTDKTDRQNTVATDSRAVAVDANAIKAKSHNNDVQAISRNSEFIYQIDRPQNASGDVVVLMHGSGGNEKSLMPFARSIWPRATLVGIRGRVVQKGQRRWYTKITATRFDQKDVSREAEAFVSFLTKLADENELDISRSTFIGYSNGANLLAVVLLQQPDLVRRAVLMRSMPVLDTMPRANLHKTSILTLSGQKDRLYSPFAPVLSSLLKNNGAKVESHMIAADHMIGELDKKQITAWLGNGNSDSLSAMSKPTK
ncbi:alpha/beta hydrolase [Bartonella sp. HY406]|uniref:alpha/beta hydrolase n=1 Tax=Bartonella sp. HY406 TaxID=2979331 RepID=UPI0021CAA36E|nr:alpha/beta hydrolase [Bartonella sp. HY406]UXN02672.1 alpha/beta hydrolase [Bartonella sp. HY406]